LTDRLKPIACVRKATQPLPEDRKERGCRIVWVALEPCAESVDQFTKDRGKIHFVCSWIKSRIVTLQHSTGILYLVIGCGPANVASQLFECGGVMIFPTWRKSFVFDQRITEIKCDGFGRRALGVCERHLGCATPQFEAANVKSLTANLLRTRRIASSMCENGLVQPGIPEM
jgi:hypothetical protein